MFVGLVKLLKPSIFRHTHTRPYSTHAWSCVLHLDVQDNHPVRNKKKTHTWVLWRVFRTPPMSPPKEMESFKPLGTKPATWGYLRPLGKRAFQTAIQKCGKWWWTMGFGGTLFSDKPGWVCLNMWHWLPTYWDEKPEETYVINHWMEWVSAHF